MTSPDPSSWKKLEDLVARLERQIGGKGLQVTRNDRIADPDTGGSRQIDVSLRGKIGSTSIFVIIECRDHVKPQNVKWIEELAGRRDSLKATKVVAVSSSGFSQPAMQKARAKDVELRMVEDITDNVIEGWATGGKAIVFRREWFLVSAAIALLDGTILVAERPESCTVYSRSHQKSIQISTIAEENVPRMLAHLEAENFIGERDFRGRHPCKPWGILIMDDRGCYAVQSIMYIVKCKRYTEDASTWETVVQYSEFGGPVIARERTMYMEDPLSGFRLGLTVAAEDANGVTFEQAGASIKSAPENSKK